MKCVLDLQSLHAEVKPYHVFFSSENNVLFKNGNSLVLSDCSDDQISSTLCPVNYRNFHILDLKDSLILLCSGRTFTIIDKSGSDPIQYDFPVEKFGRIVTKMFLCEDNVIIFGTILNNKVQFIKYDFIKQKRINQTKSWEASFITDFIVNDKVMYAVLDRTLLVACDSQNCDILWNKFEIGLIEKDIIVKDSSVFYASQNSVKNVNPQLIKNIHIPFFNTERLIDMYDHKVYFVTGELKKICCFDVISETIMWSIENAGDIQDVIKINCINGSINYDCFVVQMNGQYCIINATVGRLIYLSNSPRIYKVQSQGNHILINMFGNQSILIKGVS